MSRWALAVVLVALVFAMGTDEIEDVETGALVKRPGVIRVRPDEACLLACDASGDRCAANDDADYAACEAGKNQCYEKCLQEAMP